MKNKIAGHTPGPWVVKGWRVSIPGTGEITLAAPNITVVTADANAALIAAAPDLLNAVEYLLTIITRNEPRLLGMMEVDYARAALLKACPQCQDYPNKENE
jgi:hypothetical protein